MALKRRSGLPGSSSGDCPQADPGDWAKKYPTLVEFLTLLKWEDGAARLPGSLTLFCDIGAWKACLKDKDANASCFVSGRTPGALLEAMEKGLANDALDWRAERPYVPGGRKRG